MYRLCTGIMLFNKQGKIFIGKRIHVKNNNWQMPQGGIRKNESYIKAATRELEEETSIKSIKIIGRLNKWLYYDLPMEYKKSFYSNMYKGQKQKWVLLFFTGNDSEININTQYQEFSEWQWENPHSVLELIVDFKLEIYKEVMENFMPLMNNYLWN